MNSIITISNDSKKRIWTVILLLIITPLGFYTKFYSGPAADWVNNSLGGVFYETSMKKPFTNRKMIIMRVPSDLNEKL